MYDFLQLMHAPEHAGISIHCCEDLLSRRSEQGPKLAESISGSLRILMLVLWEPLEARFVFDLLIH